MRRQVLRKICAREPGSLEVQPQLYTSCGLMKIYQALIVLLVLLERGNGFYVPSLGRLNHESAAVKTHGCGFREAMPMLPSWAIKGAVGDEEKNQSMEDLSGGANTMYDDLRESLKGTCIYLVGMMGKTAVGAGLAAVVPPSIVPMPPGRAPPAVVPPPPPPAAKGLVHPASTDETLATPCAPAVASR